MLEDLQGRAEPAKVMTFGDGMIFKILLRFLPAIVKNSRCFLFCLRHLVFLLEPLVIPYLFLAIGVIARWRRWRWIMRFSFTTAIALPLFFGILPLSSLPLQFLENRIPRGEIGAKHIDGIIVLGGFTGNGLVAKSHNQYGLNG